MAVPAAGDATAALPVTVLQALHLAEVDVSWDAARREARRVLLWNVDRVYQLLLLHAADPAHFGTELAINLRGNWEPRDSAFVVAAVVLGTAYASTAVAASVPVTVHLNAASGPRARGARDAVARLAAQEVVRAAPLSEVVAALVPALQYSA